MELLNTFYLAAEPKINYLHSSNGVSKLISLEHKPAFPLWEAPKWLLLMINDNGNFVEELITGMLLWNESSNVDALEGYGTHPPSAAPCSWIDHGKATLWFICHLLCSGKSRVIKGKGDVTWACPPLWDTEMVGISLVFQSKVQDRNSLLMVDFQEVSTDLAKVLPWAWRRLINLFRRL